MPNSSIATGGGTPSDVRAASDRTAAPTEVFVSRAALLAKLTNERYETEDGYSAEQRAHRQGWNALADEMLAWLTEATSASDDAVTTSFERVDGASE